MKVLLRRLLQSRVTHPLSLLAFLVLSGSLIYKIPTTVGRFLANVGDVQLTRVVLSAERCGEAPRQIAITGAVIRCTFAPEQVNAVVAWLGASIGNGSDTWLAAYKMAIAYSLLGKWDNTENLLDASIELAPTASLARMARANMRFVLGQTSDAIKDWESIGAWGTLNRFALFYLTFPELRQRGLDYLGLVSKNGDTVAAGQAFYLLANDLRNRGDVVSAVPYFEHAVQHQPGKTEYYFTLASALQELGRFDDALTILQKAISLGDPNWMAELYAKSGDENIYLGNFQEAAQAYKQAVTLAPTRAFSRIRLGGLYRRLGDLDGSLSQLLLAKDFAVSDEKALVFYELAQTYCGLQKDELAIASFDNAIQLEPNHPEYFAELARCYVRLGRPNDAVLAYRRALELAPTNQDYLNSMQSILKAR